MRGVVNEIPSVDYLRERLRYEPHSGKLFWLSHECMSKRWHTRYAEEEAFTAHNSSGYRIGAIDDAMFLAHRIIWALYYKEYPSGQIDHINGIRTDNCITNLRVVSSQGNARNRSMCSNNSSGTCGVYWRKDKNKWQARIVVDGQDKHLGYFDTREEAASIRAEAAKKYGFTERHGT